METLRVATVAGKQWGVIGISQLRDCGVTASTVSRWRQRGTLHLLHPGVYAFGHRSIPIDGRMVAALLHAGPDSSLSHATAAWWWGLTDEEPVVIEVSSTAHSRSCKGVFVHQRRHFDATRYRRFPITTIQQTLLDFAATASVTAVRRALAEADYRKLLDPDAVAATAGRGRPGSARLREALARHQPRLARTRSQLEREFLGLCERAGIPLPDVNARVNGWTVDALWRRERVVVELDGYDNHRTPAQIERDRRKELQLRAAGFVVLRYTWDQINDESHAVVADVLAMLERAAA
jgi:predicted transcriptional regulator of viral defense system